MIWLLALVTLTVVGGGLRAALRPGGVQVDHVVLFSFGIGFYWLLPVAAGTVRILSGEPGLALWYATWDAAARSGALPSFLVLTLAAYLAFVSGSWLGGRLRPTTVRRPSVERPVERSVRPPDDRPAELPRDPRLLRLFLVPAVVLTALYAWLLRAQLFRGYQILMTAEDGARGTLSACSLLLLALCLLRVAEVDRWPRARRGLAAALTDPFLVAYAVSAVLVLSLGGRLYVVSAVIMAVVYHTVYHRPLPIRRALLFALVAMVLSGVAGTIRSGHVPSPFAILVNLFAEPLFTSFSLLHFLPQPDAPWVAVPQFLLGDLLNLVPSAIFPTKGQYLIDPMEAGYDIFSPLGALNSYVSLTINFGRLGTPFVLFALGAALGVLRRRESSLARVVYTMLAGWLPFTFFRDPFSISVVKNMFEFSVLVPTLLFWSTHVLTVVAPRRPTVVPVADGAP